jgi:glycosyltransferase involved in cell wall biosynthesis
MVDLVLRHPHHGCNGKTVMTLDRAVEAPGGRRSFATSGAPTPMHVLLVAPYAPIGGGMGRVMAYLAEQPSIDGLSFEMVESRGGGTAIASLWTVARAAWRIRQYARQTGRIVVHLNVAEGSSVWRKGLLLLFSDWLGLTTVLHLHAADIMAFYDRLPAVPQGWVRRFFERASVCIVLGQPWACWLRTRLRIDQGRIEILRNGVPSPEVLPFTTQRGPTLLVFLGNLLPRKGLADLLTALAEPTLRYREWELVVAGGGNAAAMKTLARQLGLDGRVRFAGWLDRPATLALLARACMLILPSTHEGLPLVLLEAASVGCPVVTTPVGAIPEVFAHEETALLVPPGDTLALSAAIVRLMDNPALHAALSRNARNLFQNELTISVFRNRLADIYQRHCADPPHRARG